MKIAHTAVALLCVAGGTLFSTPSQAANWKYYSVGGCAPYTTGTPNYSQLRIRPESVQNQSNGYLYVICPIVRDTEVSWNFDSSASGTVYAYFRTNTAGTFQCTLNIGSNRTALWTETKSTNGNPGDLLQLGWAPALPPDPSEAPVSLVCRLPPKGSIVAYSVLEEGNMGTNTP